MKNILLICYLLFSTFNGYSQSRDTFEVHFPLNISKLGKEEQAYIDRLVFKDQLLHGDKLIVLGYADFVGGSGYNDTLSLTRATNVRNYLVTTGFDEKDIKLCIGKGKIDRTNVKGNDGYAPDRKVQIIIDRVAMARKPPPGETTPQAPGTDVQIDLSKLEVNQTFALNNIFFKLNSPVILDKSLPDLQRLLDFLHHYPTVHVQIEGHVCCMGAAEGTDSKYKGRNLSECRAEAIYNYLVEKGINKERLKYAGLANRNPVVQNEVTEEDRQKNRRVEIRILSK
jgi:outer membrane protein OmpA-like peptidoglycan-associated protein